MLDAVFSLAQYIPSYGTISNTAFALILLIPTSPTLICIHNGRPFIITYYITCSKRLMLRRIW